MRYCLILAKPWMTDILSFQQYKVDRQSLQDLCKQCKETWSITSTECCKYRYRSQEWYFHVILMEIISDEVHLTRNCDCKLLYKCPNPISVTIYSLHTQYNRHSITLICSISKHSNVLWHYIASEGNESIMSQIADVWRLNSISVYITLHFEHHWFKDINLQISIISWPLLVVTKPKFQRLLTRSFSKYLRTSINTMLCLDFCDLHFVILFCIW